MGALPEESKETDVGELPEAPPLDDPGAFEAWRDALVTLMLERGRNEGKELGLKEGEARGCEVGRHEERANAILDVLRRRGIALSDADAQRVLACRDETALALYWERAFSAASAAELLGD